MVMADLGHQANLSQPEKSMPLEAPGAQQGGAVGWIHGHWISFTCSRDFEQGIKILWPVSSSIREVQQEGLDGGVLGVRDVH